MAVSQVLSVTEVSGSVNTTGNTSKVRILWTSTQTGESWNDYTRTAKYYVSINGGAESEYSISYNLPKNSTETIVDTTITVAHKTDGTGTVRVRTWMDTGISAGVVEKSSTLTLTAIPREATFDSLSCSTDYFTGVLTLKYTPKSSSLYYRGDISVAIGGGGGFYGQFMLASGQSQLTHTITFTDSQISSIYGKSPSGTKGKVYIYLSTYSDSACTKLVGSAQYKEITLNIPNDETTQPTVDSLTLSPSNSLSSPYNGLYIQGISKVKATTFTHSAKYGATIVASSITVNGKTYDSPYESDILPKEGKVTVKATVKDSRGFYGTNYKDIEVIPYSKPYVRAKSGETSIIAARCDASANFTDSGAYLKIKAKVVYSKVISNGVQNNYGKIKFRYRKEGGSYSAWQTILDCKAQNSDEVITAPLLNGALDIKSSYQVQIVAFDDLGESAPITFAIASDKVYMDRPAGGKSMGLGGYAQGDGNLDVYWKIKARKGISIVDDGGNETDLASRLSLLPTALANMPLPRDQVSEGWNPDNLENGVYAVTSAKALKQGDTVIMYNGVLIQMTAYVGGNVKVQLALTSDENKNPFYRVHWYGNWGNWRSFKL